MKSRVKLILWRLFAYSVMAAIFVWSLVDSLHDGQSVLYSIITAIFIVLAILSIIGLLVFLGWRLFTPEGREAERQAQALHDIKKTERKRDREWRQMNR